MVLASRFAGLSTNDDDRATTPKPGTEASAAAISSVIPSAKKFCAASPERFSSGNTVTVGRARRGHLRGRGGKARAKRQRSHRGKS